MQEPIDKLNSALVDVAAIKKKYNIDRIHITHTENTFAIDFTFSPKE